MNAPRASLSNLIRSTPVRIALWLVLVFGAVNLVTLGGAYLTLKAQTEAAIRADLASEMAGLDITATPGALRTLVEVRARAADPAERVYLFIGDDGRRAGNADARMTEGQVILSAAAGDTLSRTGYMQEVRRLSSGVLVIAQSLDRLEDLRRTFLWLLALSLLPTFVLSLGLGTLIARRPRCGGRRRPDPHRARCEPHGRAPGRSDRGAAAGDLGHRPRSAHAAPTHRGPARRDAGEDRRGRPPRAPGRARPRRGRSRGTGLPGAVALTAALPDAPVRVTGDRALLGQALANLIENALRHGDGTPITLSVTGHPDGSASVTVADKGPGIPPEEREPVTRRLYRLERSRTTPGNGLGLALVAAIAQAHRATLTLSDNAPGLAATLTFPAPE